MQRLSKIVRQDMTRKALMNISMLPILLMNTVVSIPYSSKFDGI
jgi:hypothetical protein